MLYIRVDLLYYLTVGFLSTFFLLFLLFHHLPFYLIRKPCLILDPNRFLSGKKSSLVENSCLPTFPGDKAETLADFITKLYWSFFLYFAFDSFLLSHWKLLYNRFFLKFNGLSDSKMKMVL